MAGEISITKVYKEVRAIRRILEELSEKGVLQSLAEEPITTEEGKELDRALEEVKRGRFVPLEKVVRG